MTLDSSKDAQDLLVDDFGPAFLAERRRLDRIDQWWRWDHPDPHQPRHATEEYKQLAARAQTPWLGLVVTAVVQALYVEGYQAKDSDDAEAWKWWQANKLDGRQIAVHEAATAYGYAHSLVLPGTDDLTGEDMPVIRGMSPRQLQAFWLDPATDDWPAFALRCESAKVSLPRQGDVDGWLVTLYDDEKAWRFHADKELKNVEYVEYEEHEVGVVPVVRFANRLDLEGRADGEVDPFVAVAGRIDQTVFDRLVVQRFASWKVRTIAGMSTPELLDNETQAEYEARTKLKLMVDGILVASDPDTKFGVLAETPLEPFVKAMDADVRTLAAVSQTPPHHLLGQMANLSAEALAAAESSLMRKVQQRRHSLGESWEQTLELATVVMGQTPDRAAQVRWADTESRSLAQAVDALTKLKDIGVPVELLLEKVPGWTQQDVDRATAIMEAGSPLDKLAEELLTGQTSAADPAQVKAKADAMGVLIRAGVDPESAAAQVGLDDVAFTGAVPTSLRLPEQAAAELEQG